ncbi:hypothetical protein KP509_03G000400 [Ceratopteris richardii]|uniref:Uncharacterized protein n=1 Tax=Ceratopteris richardii TaxID=49495 RepID=A0A8T2UWH1_CERRI|nr:hypothetical protein KP509_03G000400 [Ceratopteris richardii]
MIDDSDFASGTYAFHLSERTMCYLLVAAGASYLVQRWQHAQKRQPLMDDLNKRTNLPALLSAIFERKFHSSLSNTMSKVCNALLESSEIESSEGDDSEVCLIDPTHVEPDNRASKCNLPSKSTAKTGQQDLGEEILCSSSYCSNSRPASNNLKDAHSLSRTYSPSFQFFGKEQACRPIWQNAFPHLQNKKWSSKSRGDLQNQVMDAASTSKPRKNQLCDSAVIQGPCSEDSGYASSSKHVDSIFPRSPTDDLAMAQNLCSSASDYSDCNEHQEKILDYPFVESKMDESSFVCSSSAAYTNDSATSNACMHTQVFVTGQNQNTGATVFLFDGCKCIPTLNSHAEQGISGVLTSKIGSKSLPIQSRISEIVSESMDNADSDTFISVGLGMATCFMVSSGQKEMEKLGKLLTKTEDLVNEMKIELEDRSHLPCTGEEDGDFFTIMTKDKPSQELARSDIGTHIHSLSNNSLCKDQIRRDDTTMNMAQIKQHEQASFCVERNAGGIDNYEQQDSYGYGTQGESSSEVSDDNDYITSLVELERKLWEAFHQRQEEKISELEALLELALTRLHAKEDELLWWKNRAQQLMQQYGAPSDVQKRESRG